jgi:chromosome segregation ATPase
MPRYYDNAPIGNTCPDIDSIIETLSGVADRLSTIADQLDCPALADLVEDLNTQSANVQQIFDGRRSPLEELRSANDTLRKWGNEQHQRADDAESEVQNLRKEINELERQ